MTIAQTRRFNNYNEGIEWLRSRIRDVTTDLIILPENWIGIRIFSNEEFNEYVSLLRELANEVGALIIGGAAYVSINNKNVSICPMVNEKGLINYSEKIYPSRATGERIGISNGNRLGIIKMNDWRVSCIICVDAMYPELTRLLAKHEVDLVANPSSISVDRVSLWRSLGLVRAFENSTYFASAMGTGYKYPDGRDVLGGSFVASPNGEYRLVIDLGIEGVFTAIIDHDEIEYARSRRGYINDLRNEFLISNILVNIVDT
ncbi:carbon-nitrogen hydrolase family protein [Vulcanisaeta sp. JCM 16159]|uniref:carbon-nitrogen hydrolase family protein n=1 Tax=Vulcanisaeta sp. JCM 16159 TaxID=1295371 RepID=UPI001FB2D733|nr:carbon-nitrogen hydrolase family protein [Vulcanisaeta sp. JCM 16159]